MASPRIVRIAPGAARNVVGIAFWPGESATVEYAVDLGCQPANANFAPYYEDGCPVLLDEFHNPLTLWRPGYYRLVPDVLLNAQADIMVSEPFAVNIGAAILNTG